MSEQIEKRNIAFTLSKEAIKKLQKLAEHHQTTASQILEDALSNYLPKALLKMEAEQLEQAVKEHLSKGEA